MGKKAIDVLNSLIVINNDRIEGYETALIETDEHDLKTLFRWFVSTSQRCKQELILEVNKLGGTVNEGTRTSGKFFRAWMDIKATLTGKDRNAILNSCEFGEEEVQDTYMNALENESEHLSAEQRAMISAQKIILKRDHEHVKAFTMHL